MRTTNIRFTGLASGLDTESMIQAMVMPYKMKVDAASQEQKLLELKKDAWKEMNGKIYAFHQNTLAKLRLENSFNKKEVTMSPPGLIEIGSSGSFPDGTHKVTVESLAEGASVSTKPIDISNKDLNGDGIIGNDKVSKDTTLKQLGITATEINITAGDITKKITITDETKISDLEKTLKDVGLSASFDETAGALFISTKETGSGQNIKIEAVGQNTGEVFNALGIKQNTIADINGNIDPFTFTGKDSKITYNGVAVTSATNLVNVNGMQIKLMGAKPGEIITVVSKSDTKATIDMVKGFVEEYNKLIDEMNKLVNAPYNKDYKPLTDEQKKDMSEEDIKLWNEKVSASILRKDPVLQEITSSMRQIISDSSVTIDGKKYTLADFGITTSLNYKEGGKLYIDEDKLTTMVNKHSEAFTQLFAGRVNAVDLAKEAYDKDNEGLTYEAYWKKHNKKFEKSAIDHSGIGSRLYEDIADRLKGTQIKSANFLFNDKELDKTITSKKDQVAKLEERMYRMEDLYYKQFAAMEKMLSQLNNQSNWLMGQLGGM